MKKTFFSIALGLITLATSCKINYTTNQVRHMPLLFDSLSRQDYTTVGDLKAEATVTLKKGKLSAKDPMIKNYKQGVLSSVAQPIIYNPMKQLTVLERLLTMFSSTRQKLMQAQDPGYDGAMFALHEKYPNIDYFVNVRIYRNYRGTKKFKSGPETVTVYATGIELKTDK